MIGIAGGTASGKTTVCDKIVQELHDHRVVLISQDSYYRGLTPEEKANVHQYNFDHPDAIDSLQLHEDIQALRTGSTINVPVYDFTTHSRKQEEVRVVNPADVVIVEGILVLQFEKIRNLCNMKIFVDTDDDVRLARRIQRDTQERGRDVAGVIAQYTNFVKPMFDAHVLPSKKFADIIIPWARGDNNVAIDLIVQHIRSKLGTDDLRRIYPLFSVIQNNFQIRGMHTIIRDRNSEISDFIFYADRLIRVVVEAGLGLLPFTEKSVLTPTGTRYIGVDFCRAICGVSLVRSGEAMETALRNCCKGIKIGKILIHRKGDGDMGKEIKYHRLPEVRPHARAAAAGAPDPGWTTDPPPRRTRGPGPSTRRRRRTSTRGACSSWTRSSRRATASCARSSSSATTTCPRATSSSSPSSRRRRGSTSSTAASRTSSSSRARSTRTWTPTAGSGPASASSATGTSGPTRTASEAAAGEAALVRSFVCWY